MRRFLIFPVLLVALPALAQTRPKSSNQVTTTRTVHIFSDLERELGAALHSGDHATIDRLLAPDFEVRRSSSPGVPVPRADFLNEPHPADVKLSQMAVHQTGSTAVVSFLAANSSNSFLVDMWTQDGATWKLVARYQCPAAASAEAPASDKRPTGRE